MGGVQVYSLLPVSNLDGSIKGHAATRPGTVYARTVNHALPFYSQPVRLG